MSKKERGRLLPPKPEPPQPYSLAARYPDGQSAEAPYFESQQVIHDNEQLELSSYRLQLRRLNSTELDWHVAIVGDQPPAEFDQRFRRILATGELVELPADVQEFLRQRRAVMTRNAQWTEGHYRPGIKRRLK